MSKSQMKAMLIIFFNITGIVHLEFIPQDQTAEILKWLCEAVCGERPELWPNDCILHHDNAPSHKALSVEQFLVQKSITEMERSPFSPDLAPNDFWLFPKVKSALEGLRLQDIEGIRKTMIIALKGIPQQAFQKCFHQWQHCWSKCIGAQEESFKGDPSQ
jgi:hypothetical protein